MKLMTLRPRLQKKSWKKNQKNLHQDSVESRGNKVMQVRTPAVAGMFYPKEKNELKTAIHDCFLHPIGPGKIPPTLDNEKILGIVSPHAGYMYSGAVATNSFYSISSQ